MNESRRIVIPNDEFFAHLTGMLGQGETVRFTVKGYSMMPFLRNEKDMVVLRPTDGTGLRSGDVILFRYRGKFILHRIISVQGEGDRTVYRTMGDGNLAGTESAVPEEVYGVMTERITPSGSGWRCDSTSWKWCSSMWRSLLPVRRWLLALLRRIYR